jgi:hypothetical protein
MPKQENTILLLRNILLIYHLKFCFCCSILFEGRYSVDAAELQEQFWLALGRQTLKIFIYIQHGQIFLLERNYTAKEIRIIEKVLQSEQKYLRG